MAFPLWLAAPLIVGATCYAGVCDAKRSSSQRPLDPIEAAALNEARSREIPDKGLRNRWPIGSAEIL